MSDRDVAAFDRRAISYDAGWLGAWHRRLCLQVAEIASRLNVVASGAVLDVGCGTGQLLRALARSLPPAVELVGVDPAPTMVAVASRHGDLAERVRFEQAAAEDLPFSDGSFDMVVSSLSFDHWADQQTGLHECARVLRPGGELVLADLFAGWLALTTVARRRGRARTPRRAERLLIRAGLAPRRWQRLYDLGPLPLVQAVIATRPQAPTPYR